MQSGTETSPRIDEHFPPNTGKQLAVSVDGSVYLRMPVKTRVIKTGDDILSLLGEYVQPHLISGDLIFVSEKALAISQGRIVNLNDVRPTKLAAFLARHVNNQFGTQKFRGFGHGTAFAMQLFLEEVGYPRILFAAALSAVTRPFGIRGVFYTICGKRAKSIDCPVSFYIPEYANYGKLAPDDSDGIAREIKSRFGCEAVILDANYLGSFSLGKSSRSISERFVRNLFKDNPLGQEDEMTPFCIVRKA